MPQFDRPDPQDLFAQHRARLAAAMAKGRKPSARPEEDPGQSPYLSVTTHGSPRAAAPSLVEKVRARLGLPKDATPADVVAELDARLAVPAATEEDRLYAAAWGTEESTPAAGSTSDLAAIAWGA